MTQNWLVLAIVVAVFVWGTVLAVGAYFFNHNLNRFMMVQGCVVVFLAFWLALLAWRGRGRPPKASGEH